MTLDNFFHMSGYGAYVWSCYGLTVAVLIGNVWAARRRFAAALERAQRRVSTLTTERT